MNEFVKTLKKIDDLCTKNSIKYAVIGGIAVITYGSYRTTKDIDITVLCELGELESVYNIFNNHFLSLPENPLEFFKKNFVLPSRDQSNGIRIDIASGLTEFDKKVIERRRRKKISTVDFFVCSIEDLIIYKLFAARYQDLADVQELILIHKKNMDKDYLDQKVKEFYELERQDMKDNLDKLFI